ncbi:hypothetical protein EG68_00061 [Paragonimus skrjabini miyazakii]|uniref:EGF-like domain-containing protein n=1 Tax=Paragonimus skrjabini miyazakii TaxID=59628 RepID=A0A8S9ZCY1_9TREM|nr:hypothetical protein EG68_00061 [Paragonimus skrjabini miyazakii]
MLHSLVKLTFVCFILSIKAQENIIDKSSISNQIYSALQSDNAELLRPYDVELFKPFGGPFFKPLWELPSPYNMYAIIGFPPLNETNSDVLLPWFRENQTLAFYDTELNDYRIYQLASNISLFDVMVQVLNKIEEGNNSHIVTDMDCGMIGLDSTSERVLYQEIVRPRYYLPTFIDTYRLLLQSAAVCTQKATEPSTCGQPFQDYSNLLWMYNWVICSMIGSSETDDVDGICPKICRPHTLDVISGNFETPEGPQFVYSKIASENALDVCEQLLHAVSGSCELTNGGRSVHMNEFRCQCISHAYQWYVNGGYRGCLLTDRILQTENDSTVRNWKVECLPSENQCNLDNTEACYFRLHRNSTNARLLPTDTVQVSYRPYCHCRPEYSGWSCNEPLDPCRHPIVGAIENEEDYLTIHINDGPHLPMYHINDSSSASGNWLCGVVARRGKCKVNEAMDGGFECICGKGYTRHTNYSKFDNCMNETTSENSTEIDGRQVVICGASFCLNNGTCVAKPNTVASTYEMWEDGSELDVTRVCQCPVGFFGASCDVEENVWSAWDSWSPCVPSCGQMRYQFRMRSCIGDAGCVGSALESARCPDTECPLLDLVETTSSQQEGYTGPEAEYHTLSRTNLLIWMLGLMLPLEVLIIFAGVVILEKCIMRGAR